MHVNGRKSTLMQLVYHEVRSMPREIFTILLGIFIITVLLPPFLFLTISVFSKRNH